MNRVFPVLMLALGLVVGSSITIAYAAGTIELLGDVLVNGALTIQDGTEGLGKVFTSDSGGTGSWQEINTSGYGVSELGFGNFDGNGVTDVFRAGGGKWYVSYDGTGPWQEINTSGYGLAELHLGDFDGNGTTDVFRTRLAIPMGTRRTHNNALVLNLTAPLVTRIRN